MVSLQPKHPLYGILVILALSILWRLVLRRLLTKMGLNDDTSESKTIPKRKISATDDGFLRCHDSSNNFLQTTTFGGSYLWVATTSFLYGAVVSS